jgi:hypothetical protein
LEQISSHFLFHYIFSHFRADFTFIRDSLILNNLNVSFRFNLTLNDIYMQIWAKRKRKKKNEKNKKNKKKQKGKWMLPELAVFQN